MVESNSMFQKWKERTSKIYLRGDSYQLDIGEKLSFPLKFGISKVDYNPNHPLSFKVQLDPTLPSAPVICASAVSEPEYHLWMAALNKATFGAEYEGGGGENSPVPLSPYASSSGVFSNNRTPSPATNVSDSLRSFRPFEEEQHELEQILELSKREK